MMKFQVGKFYKYIPKKTGQGLCIHVLAYVNSIHYGECYLAESQKGDLVPVDRNINASLFEWKELSQKEFEDEKIAVCQAAALATQEILDKNKEIQVTNKETPQ